MMVFRNVNEEDRQLIPAEALTALFDLADDLLALLDEDGKFVRLNASLAQFLDVTAVDNLSRHYLDFVQAADRPEAAGALEQAAEGETVSLTVHFEAGDGDFRRVRWKLTAYAGLVLAAGRRLADTQPLTATDEVEQRQLLAILEATPDIIGISDARGMTLYMNPAGRQLLGFAPDEDLSGRNIGEYSPPWAAELLVTEGLPTAAQTGVWAGETALYDAEGNEVPISQVLLAHKGEDGRPERFSTIIRDISEQKLSETEREHLVDILEAAPDFIGIAGLQGLTQYLNPAGRDLMGFDLEQDLSEVTIADYVTPQSAQQVGAVGIPTAIEEGLWIGDVTLQSQDGEEIPASQAIVAHKDEEGEVVRFSTIIRDMRRQREAEEELRLLARVVEQSLDGTAVSDLDGNIRFANPAWVEMHGYDDAAELLGQSLTLFHTEEQLEQEVEPLNRRVLATGEPQQDEVGHVRRDGMTFPTLMTVAQLRDAEGEPVGLVASARDIEAQKQVQAEREQLVDILDSAPDFIGFVDEQGKTQYLNPAGREMMGFGANEDLSEIAMPGYLAPESLPQLDEMVATTVQEGFWQGETLFQSRQGEKIPTSQALIAHTNAAGEVVRFSTIVRDISEWKAAEEQVAQQARQLALVNEVSAVAATILEVDELLRRAVDLTQQRFGLYHTHIYLLNAAGDALLLTAGAGDVGRRMVAEGRTISLDARQSLVARVARERSGLIVNDVREDPGFLPHPLLPETRAEMAVPIIAGEKLVGVLDVQADEINRFSEADVNVQTALAAQIAIALENARSFEQAQQALAELDAVTRRLTREGWESYMVQHEQAHAFLYDSTQAQPVTPAPGDRPLPAGSESSVEGNGRRLARPLEVHGATVGRLALEAAADTSELDEDTEAIMAAVAGQLSARIENIRLTEQTQNALMNSERQAARLAELNELGTTLSTAPSMEAVFAQAARRTNEIVGGERSSLTLFQEESNTLKLFALDGEAGAIPTGAELPVDGTGVGQVFQNGELMYQEDLAHYDYLENKPLLAQGLRSALVAPLIGRAGTLGTLNVGSKQVDAFTVDDANLFRQLAALLAAIIENRRLSGETERYAAQLEELASLEADLSQATAEGEIMAAVAPHFSGEQPPAEIILNYIETDDAGRPQTMEAVAVWQDGRIIPDFPTLGRALNLSEDPVAELWIDQPYEPLLVEDMQADPRVNERMREEAASLHFRGTAVIPLYSGRRWQGSVVFVWPEPHAFTQQEQFLMRQLVEPLSATVAGRRAYIAQQEALTETSALYQAGSELNRARTYEAVLEVLHHHTVLGKGDAKSAIMAFDTTWTESEQPEWINIAATWPAEMAEMGPPRVSMADMPTLPDLLSRDAPVLVEDVLTDERIGEDLRYLFAEVFHARGMILAPLVVGGQWIGYLTAQYPQTREFVEREVRRLLTLVGQAAVAIQNINLLEETSRLLASEQRQRRIADTMLRATERMSGILDENQIREIMVDEIHSLLRPAQVNLYQWEAGAEVFAVLQQVGIPGASKPRHRPGEQISAAEAPELWQVLDDGQPSLEVIEGNGEGEREAYRFVWLIGNERAGVMEILRPAGAAIMRDEDRASVVGMVQQAAIRLQNARLFTESEMRAEELAVLNEMGRALTALTDVQEVVDTVYQYTSHLMDTTNFYIALYEPGQEMLSFPLAIERGKRVNYQPRPYASGMTEHLIEAQEPLLLQDNVGEYLASVGLEQYGELARSWVGVPLVFGNQVLGAIGLQSYTEPQIYNEHSLEILGSIASQAAIAIQNAELFEEIQQRVAETQTLYETSQAINTSQSYEGILDALRIHTFLGPADHVSLNYFDRPWTETEEPELIRVLARHTSLSPEMLRPAYEFRTFPSRQYLEKQRPVLMEDVENEPRLDESVRMLLQLMQAKSTIFIPLVAGGQWLGFIHAVYQEQTAFPEAEVERLSTLIGQAAVAIQGLQLLQDAQNRVRREQILREVTSSVRSVTDVELILKTAARQVGQALGRETFVYLGGDDDETSSTPPAGEEGR